MSGKIIALNLMVAIVPGCGSKLEPVDVVGTYQAELSYGVETLTLKPDGAYEQQFKYNNGKELRNKGTWQFSAVTKNNIRLSNALMVDDGFGKPSATVERGNWIIGVRKNIVTGSVSLNFNDDLAVAFKKK
jgi:hypothetical protein